MQLNNPIIVGVLVVVSFIGSSQSLEQQRSTTDKHLMLGLGSWAATNIIVGSVGWSSTNKTATTYFHEMNVMWNVVNMSLAIPGYLKARRHATNLTVTETLELQKRTEKIYLLNAYIDLGYVSSGLIMGNIAKQLGPNHEQLSGYGKSLVLQGGFLLLFDVSAYLIHRKSVRKINTQLINNLEINPSRLSITWTIPHRHKAIY